MTSGDSNWAVITLLEESPCSFGENAAFVVARSGSFSEDLAVPGGNAGREGSVGRLPGGSAFMKASELMAAGVFSYETCAKPSPHELAIDRNTITNLTVSSRARRRSRLQRGYIAYLRCSLVFN